MILMRIFSIKGVSNLESNGTNVPLSQSKIISKMSSARRAEAVGYWKQRADEKREEGERARKGVFTHI